MHEHKQNQCKRKVKNRKNVVGLIIFCITVGIVFLYAYYQNLRKEIDARQKWLETVLAGEKKWILENQGPEGEFYMNGSKAGDVNPYFACMAALGLLAETKNCPITETEKKAVGRYLDWHTGILLETDGKMGIYRKESGKLIYKEKADSEDGYLGMYLFLMGKYLEKTESTDLPESWKKGISLALKKIQSLMQDGITQVSEENTTVYLMDNLEVWKGLYELEHAGLKDEQAIREIYLKGFEYTVTIGNTNAAMAGMNRIGARWVGAHKGLMTNVLRGEWGFEGMVITDQASVPAMFYQDIVSGLAAGTDLWLNTNKSYWALDSYAEEDGSTTDWTSNATVMNNVARAAKNVIYAVGTSNAMDSVSDDGTVASQKAPWEIALIILDIIVFGICGLLIILTSIRWAKYAKSLPKQEEEGDDIVKKNKVVVLVIVAVLLGLLVGGFGTRLIGGTKSSGNAGNSAASDAGAAKGSVYIFGEDKENSYGGTDYDEYQLTLKEDGTYEMVMTEATFAYDMLLGHTSVTTYGTYEKGDSSDGATACKLSEATRIVYNSYSDVGGYNLSYDTDSIDEYPIELPGGIMTEKEDFFAQYGAERTAYLDDANPSQMSFEE